MTDEEISIEVHLVSSIPQRDLFHRDQPASLEGSREAWELALTTIDFGCALLTEWKGVRPSTELKDAVVAALLRRTLITAEGIRTLLGSGLLEPAVALSRTLLEIELSLKLILRDQSGTMAKRLAAYHYLTYQRHGEDQLRDPTTRQRATEAARAHELAQISGSYKRFLELQIFDEVRAAIKSKRSWHGFDSMEEAFRAAGESPDYFILYDSGTWFVHAVNVDFDFADRVGTEMRLKALVERSPTATHLHLGHLALRLTTVLRLISDYRGYPTSPPFDTMSRVRYPNGEVEEITALDALTGQVTQVFGLGQGTD